MSTNETDLLLSSSREECNNPEHLEKQIREETNIQTANDYAVEALNTPPPISPFSIIPPLFLHVLSFTICMVPIEQWFLLYVCAQSSEKISIQELSWDVCRQNVQVQASFSIFFKK